MFAQLILFLLVFIGCGVLFAIGMSYQNGTGMAVLNFTKKKSEKMKNSKIILDTQTILLHLIERKCDIVITYVP